MPPIKLMRKGANTKKKPVVKSDPGITSGTPCFAGTRVPVCALLDYIEGGQTLDEFLEQYPTVSRKQAVTFLEKVRAKIGRVTNVEPLPKKELEKIYSQREDDI